MNEPAQGRANRWEVVHGDPEPGDRERLVQRVEILTRHDRDQAEIIQSLRAELHEAHRRAQAHDEEIRQALALLVQQRDALAAHLLAAETRLEQVRRSLPGRVWKFAKLCKLRVIRRSA